MVGPSQAGGGAAILARLRAQRLEKAKSSTPSCSEVTVLYGSQTGTAQDIAMRIQADASIRGVQAKVSSGNKFGFAGVSAEKTPVIVFIVSSTGDGDPPDNCSIFFRDLRTEQMSNRLKGIQFTVLGLGDSSYSSFMNVPRELKKNCLNLGATLFYEYKEADEMEELDEIAEAWVTGLWEPLKQTMAGVNKRNTGSGQLQPTKIANPVLSKAAIPKSLDELDVENIIVEGAPSLPPRRLKVDFGGSPGNIRIVQRRDESMSATGSLTDNEKGSYGSQEPYWADVSNARLMTAPWSDRRVVHVELDINGSGLVYHPGDSLGIMPENSNEMVTALAQRLSVPANAIIRLSSSDDASDQAMVSHIKSPCTVTQALAHKCDITSPPRKLLLRYLAEACTDTNEKKKMLYLCSRSGRDVYRACILEEQLSLLDVLSKFPSCMPTLDYLLDLLPPLAPRLYSVTSYMDAHPEKVQFAFTLVKVTNACGSREGVATGWMNKLLDPIISRTGPDVLKLPIHVKLGNAFRPPERIDEPWILIGPGTGVAPFRGFLEKRMMQMMGYEGTLGPCWLFFGCRREDEDFLYRDELQGFLTNGTLARLELAFSRQDDEKMYVQHKMKTNGKRLFELIFELGGYVFVCGDGQGMARDVHNCLIEILQEHGNMSKEAATSVLVDMAKIQKYVRDVWS